MKAWRLLKHLEEGGKIKTKAGDWTEAEFHHIRLGDLSGWDYDPLRNPEGWEIVEEAK